VSRRAGASTASTLLAGGLVGLAAGGLGYLLTHRRVARASLAQANDGRATSAEERDAAAAPRVVAARRLYAGSAALAASVLVDSAMEHYRGGFYNPVMYVAPMASALTVAVSGAAAAGVGAPLQTGTPVYAAATLTGLVGSALHTYNISKREGGWRWHNLFYGAPLAAPMGLVFGGLFGLAADRLLRSDRPLPKVLGMPLGEALAVGSATGLVGTAAEAGLLHFRGAFHDPYMFLPLTVPPLAALTLTGSLLAPGSVAARSAGFALRLTEALGFAGVGFHAFGIKRNMGGWRNWSQNVQQGPPLPAPPSFTGMALAGRAGLALLEAHGSRSQAVRGARLETAPSQSSQGEPGQESRREALRSQPAQREPGHESERELGREPPRPEPRRGEL
jgi:hypothetical protein